MLRATMRTAFLLVVALLVACAIALALSTFGRVGDALSRTRVHTYGAVLRCSGIAEDSAAHVTLIHYSAHRIVYRCDRTGY